MKNKTMFYRQATFNIHPIFKEKIARSAVTVGPLLSLSDSPHKKSAVQMFLLLPYREEEKLGVPAGFGKGGGTQDLTANILWVLESPRECQKEG